MACALHAAVAGQLAIHAEHDAATATMSATTDDETTTAAAAAATAAVVNVVKFSVEPFAVVAVGARATAVGFTLRVEAGAEEEEEGSEALETAR